MGLHSADNLTGSFVQLMDNLIELEKTIHPTLRVYRWQPHTLTPPAVWNWINTSPFENRDLGRHRDTFNIAMRIGIAHSDIDVEMRKMEEYIDAAREVIDPALHVPRPLGAARAWRLDMKTGLWDFWSVPILGFEMTLQFQIERIFQPNQ